MGASGGPGGHGGLGPFEAVRGLTIEAVLPPVVHVRQTLSDAALPDVAAGRGRGSRSASGASAARDADRADRREPGDPRQAGCVAGRG